MALSTAGPVPPRRARQRLMKPWRVNRAGLPLAQSGVGGWLCPGSRLARWQWDLSRCGCRTRTSKERLLACKTRRPSRWQKSAGARCRLDSDRDGCDASDSGRGQDAAATARQSHLCSRPCESNFLASNLQALPPQKAYELWLIPMNGAPIPAGVFKPDAHGSAAVVEPPLPAGVQAKAFAITVEPESGSSAPTLPVVMLGLGE